LTDKGEQRIDSSVAEIYSKGDL
jgi:hypothetical protein